MKQRWIRSVILGGVVLLAAPPVPLAAQNNASLVVQIVAMGALDVAPPALSADPAALSIPVKATIRLNRGASGTLSIARVAQAAPSLEVATEQGWRPLSESPVVLRQFTQSGTYLDTTVIVRSEPATQPVSLVLSLTSSDGAIAVSRSVTIPAAASSAASTAVTALH